MAPIQETTADELISLRNEVDLVDHKLHLTLLKRLQLVAKIAQVKAGRKSLVTPPYIPDREAHILKQHRALINSQVDANYIKDIYRAIFAVTRRVQQQFSIGVHINNSQNSLLAAVHHFGDQHHFHTNDNIQTLIQTLNANQYDYLVISEDDYDAHSSNDSAMPPIYAVFALQCISTKFFVLNNPARTINEN